MKADCDVVVAGAGISGLVTAFFLQQRGLQVEVMEAGARTGGLIASCKRDGALYELGPNSTLDTSPLINELLRHLRILDQRVDASPVAARRFIIRNGHPVALPASPGAFLTTAAFSLAGKLRLLREPFIAPAGPNQEESVAAFARRRLGAEFLNYAVDPFVAGIYAGDADELSMPAAFPRLHALEQRYGSLIKGQIKGRRERTRHAQETPSAAGSFSFRNGMQTLSDALAGALHAVHCDAPAHRVASHADATFTVSGHRDGTALSRRAKAVVLAVPADAAAGLVEGFDDDAARSLRGIGYAPITIVASLYGRNDVRHALDGFGFLVPRSERRRILGSLFSSSMFPGRAPEGAVLLTTFAGGRRNPEIAALSDPLVARLVSDELAVLVGAVAAPRWQEIVRRSRAIPQYTLGHLQRVRAIEAVETRAPGLYFCASYRGGVSVGDCIQSGHAMAMRIAEALSSR